MSLLVFRLLFLALYTMTWSDCCDHSVHDEALGGDKQKCLRVLRHQEMGSQISVHSLLATLREQHSHGDRHRNKQPEITEEALFDILRKDTYRFRTITYVQALPSRRWKPSQPPSVAVATAPLWADRYQQHHGVPVNYTAAPAVPNPLPHPSNWRSWAPVPTSKPMGTLSFSSSSTSRSEESDYSEPNSGDRPHIREGNRKRSRSRRGRISWDQVYEEHSR